MEEQIQQLYGVLPSPIDNRDYQIVKSKEPFPEEFRLSYIPPVKNQGSINSCVSHSLSYINEYYYKNETNDYIPFSVGFIYGYRPNGYNQTSGMYPREALKTECDKGNVLFNNFPYNEEVPEIQKLVNANINSLDKIATQYRISSYCRLNSIDDIKTALLNNMPVTISYTIYKKAFKPDWNGNISIPDKLDVEDGSHMVTIFGWTKDNRWIVENSWGKFWGKSGICYISFDYPFNEAWSVSDNIKSPVVKKPSLYWFWNLIYKIRNLF
ncbi:MAG TPA: C1 family peptidase [Candidatus Paceibacterota bacterium]